MSGIYSDRPWPDLKGYSSEQTRKLAAETLSCAANALTGLVALLESHQNQAFHGLAAILKNVEDDAWLALVLMYDEQRTSEHVTLKKPLDSARN
ncbi:MAG TPA: hypothetical protein P5149_14365 [Candidatus Competibacteraceae bacterium]|nr:hypothetical protein [Candidatus Competibacteraceae bacterium]